MKLKKKQKRFVIIFSVIIGILLVYFLGFKTNSIMPFSIGYGGNLITTMSLGSEDEKSATYSFSYSSDSLSSDCTSKSSETYELSIGCNPYNTQSLPKFVSGLQNVYFKTSIVTMGGSGAIFNPCSGSPAGADIVFDKKEAKCRIYGAGLVDGVERAFMDCTFTGEIHPEVNNQKVSASMYGFSSGTAQVKIYKVGYNIITVYRLSNNKCSEMEILDTDKTANDYMTLAECNSHITCTPSWECTEWGTCTAGFQNRLCTDKNNCNEISGKPIESKVCGTPDECPTGKVLCTDGTCKDSCGTEEPKTNYWAIALIIGIMILLTGGLFFVYKKFKK